METGADEQVPMSVDQIREFLKTNQNPHVFHPKEPPEVSEIPEERLKTVFGSEQEVVAETIIPNLRQFVSEGAYISDGFGSGVAGHRQRVAWRRTLRQEHPEVVRYLLRNNNLGATRISSAINCLALLGDKATVPELQESIKSAHDALLAQYRGENEDDQRPYVDLETPGKIAYVKRLESEIVRTLKSIADFSPEFESEEKIQGSLVERIKHR